MSFKANENNNGGERKVNAIAIIVLLIFLFGTIFAANAAKITAKGSGN